jgi:hypothetical protein
MLNDGIRALSEYDVQGLMFLAFRKMLANTRLRADRETQGKTDCVVLEGSAPRVFYEIKTYFKPREKLRVADFEKDLKKLSDSKSKHPDSRAYFLVAASKSKVNDLALRAVPTLKPLVHPKSRTWLSFPLQNGERVRLRPSKREEYGRSVILTWELK